MLFKDAWAFSCLIYKPLLRIGKLTSPLSVFLQLFPSDLRVWHEAFRSKGVSFRSKGVQFRSKGVPFRLNHQIFSLFT